MCKFTGYRNRGRQRRRWTDDIAEWTGMKINEVTTAAEDRDHWRGILPQYIERAYIYCDTTRRQPFLWRKALNDDDEYSYLFAVTFHMMNSLKCYCYRLQSWSWVILPHTLTQPNPPLRRKV